jgi:lysozyme
MHKTIKILLTISLFVPILLWINELFHTNIAQVQRYIQKDIKIAIDIASKEIKRAKEILHIHTNTTVSKHAIGIDVSHYQEKIDFDKLNGIDFVIVKATGGHSYVDPMFYHNWEATRSKEIIRGAYHFYYASDSAKSQAKHYLDTIKLLKSTDLPPILDVEILDNSTKDSLILGVLQWLDIVQKTTKKRPIIYSSLSFYESYLNDKRLQKYPIWIADYGNVSIKKLHKKLPNNELVMWQYTQHGKISGIVNFVDKSIYNGTLQHLKEFISKSNKE